MMEKDPILERQQREAESAKQSNLKTVMYILIAVVVVLVAVLSFIWISKARLVGQLQIEKQDLTAQVEKLQSDYANLSSNYANINSQLDTSRAKIATLIEDIAKTKVENRRAIRRYERELGTLRSIMRNYVKQIDSLNTLNKQLTKQVASARKEIAVSKMANQQLTKKVEQLSDKVAVGSMLKARQITVIAQKKNGKTTDRARKVYRLMTTLSLLENDLAQKGLTTVYLVVKGPDGSVLTNTSPVSFSLAGKQMIASASREVDYEGKEVEMSIYLNGISHFSKGLYTVEVYTTKSDLGTAELNLR